MILQTVDCGNAGDAYICGMIGREPRSEERKATIFEPLAACLEFVLC